MTTHQMSIGITDLYSGGYASAEGYALGTTMKAECPCGCPCCTPGPAASVGPVRYQSGELLYSQSDLSASGF